MVDCIENLIAIVGNSLVVFVAKYLTPDLLGLIPGSDIGLFGFADIIGD